MATTIRKTEYYYTTVPHRPGEGARAMEALAEAGVNLLAFHGFPTSEGAQLDFVPEDPGALRSAADAAGIELTGPKTAFVVEGEDRIGAVAEIVRTLADAGINLTAMDAVCGGDNRFGALFWVAPDDVGRAAEALGAD